MRCIEIADYTRSILFYRDVLGFQIHQTAGVVEATYGPARLQFQERGDGPGADSSAQVFFQTDDAAGMQSAIRARGGAVTMLERVNWIKMEMFEVRDPDGHMLWFGESFDQPCTKDPTPMVQQALPELPVSDVPAAIEYYRNVLGFKINYAQDDLGVMYRDAVTILLIERTERHTGIGSTGFYIADADKLHAELKARGANVEGEPVSYPWGLRAFRVFDMEGNRLTFSQTFE